MWHTLVENPNMIEDLYTNVPSLEHIFLLEVRLNYQPTQCYLRIDLPRMPDILLKAWTTAPYNTAQLVLVINQIRSIHIEGWREETYADIEIAQHATHEVSVRVSATNTILRAKAESLVIQSIKPYIIRNTTC